MKKSKFTGEQIVRMLKEVEAGAKAGETCRKHGISEPTYCVWKSKYAGLEVSQLRHLKDVEAEPGSVETHVRRLSLGTARAQGLADRSTCLVW
ncbi:transposase [Lysobacter enzymogenes]|uniref:Transposase n=1 Tax=Lysobacter enzymogenes TaxID=69 RepID=A0A3N2RDQ8_LYSEN|nr:transposase [Lysobacter enzymogenes]ROU05602.1 transposase [Lysobacter enzymogenes]